MIVSLVRGISFFKRFVDNIIVYSMSWNDHVIHVKTIMKIMTAANLRFNFSNCIYLQEQLVLLGSALSHKKLQVDAAKVSLAMKILRPTTGKQVMSLLGLYNFFRKTFHRMAEITKFLDDLRYNKVICPTDWDTSCDRAISLLHETLKAQIAIHQAEFSIPFYVATDASDVGIGACLYQIVNETIRYVRFYFRCLHESEVH
jgi:RNase H-like domain found in reverse transcriptase